MTSHRCTLNAAGAMGEGGGDKRGLGSKKDSNRDADTSEEHAPDGTLDAGCRPEAAERRLRRLRVKSPLDCCRSA